MVIYITKGNCITKKYTSKSDLKNGFKLEFGNLRTRSFGKCFKGLKMFSKEVGMIFGENENGLMDFEVI